MARRFLHWFALSTLALPVSGAASLTSGNGAITAELSAPTGNILSGASFSEFSAEELTKINGKKSPLADASEGVTLTINLIYNDGDYAAKTFYVYNEDAFIGGNVSRYDPEGHTIVLENITPGTYTVMGAFDEMLSHPGQGWTKCYVFAEDAKVEADTEVNIEAALAVNQFIGTSYLSDGEVARIDNNGYDENLEPLFVPGNCRDKLITTTIFDTKYNAWIANTVGKTGTYAMDNIYGPGLHWRPEEMYNIMVNDISERFVVCQQRDNFQEDGKVSTVAYSRGITNLDLSNDVSNYRVMEEQFTHTPAFEIYDTPDENYHFTELGYQAWSYFPATTLPWKMENPFVISYSSSANSGEFEDFHPFYRFQLYDALADWTEFYLKGQRFSFDDEGAFYVFSNFYAPSEVSGTRAVGPDGEEVYYEFPGHPGLRVNAYSPTGYVYGNSAAVNTMAPIIYKNGDSFYTNLTPSFKGLLGEERAADNIGLYVEACHDGISEEEGGEDWNSYWREAPNANPSGIYEAVMVNDQNIMVEGIEGYNISRLSFSYERADICPPVIQALQFRNHENLFSRDFTISDDVRVVVCAGDYDWWETPDYLEYNYETKPVTVTIEMSQNSNADDSERFWIPLEVTEIEEYANLSGYGRFFEGTIMSLDCLPYNGWFDLRITVTDEAGNTNQQILGPAFRIGDTVGVDSLSTADNAASLIYKEGAVESSNNREMLFRVYSADGSLIMRTQSSRISLGNLPAGMYVVTADADGRTLSVKINK